MKHLAGKSIISNLYESNVVDNMEEIEQEYREAYGKDLDLEHVPCVKARDSFLSGWGMAQGTPCYQVVLCGSSVEAANLEDGMKRVAKKEGLTHIRRDYNGIVKGNVTVSYKIGVNSVNWGGNPKYKTMAESVDNDLNHDAGYLIDVDKCKEYLDNLKSILVYNSDQYRAHIENLDKGGECDITIDYYMLKALCKMYEERIEELSNK